jgi:uncharacterized membrane protein
VGTGILPVLYGQAIPPSAGLSHQSVAELGMSSPNTNQTKLLATAINGFIVITTVLVGICAFASLSLAWNFTVPAQEVRPVNGAFVFPASAFTDGKAKHFLYKHANNQWIRFFVVKSTDGVVRAAFDACDVCFRAKKGYVQQGNDMVCINCGLKFRTDKINEVRGGCNPGPLKRTLKDGNVIITQQDVLSGLRYFQ